MNTEDIGEFMEEMNELSVEYYHSGDTLTLARLQLTMYAVSGQLGLPLYKVSIKEPYLDTVPP